MSIFLELVFWVFIPFATRFYGARLFLCNSTRSIKISILSQSDRPLVCPQTLCTLRPNFFSFKSNSLAWHITLVTIHSSSWNSSSRKKSDEICDRFMTYIKLDLLYQVLICIVLFLSMCLRNIIRCRMFLFRNKIWCIFQNKFPPETSLKVNITHAW